MLIGVFKLLPSTTQGYVESRADQTRVPDPNIRGGAIEEKYMARSSVSSARRIVRI